MLHAEQPVRPVRGQVRPEDLREEPPQGGVEGAGRVELAAGEVGRGALADEDVGPGGGGGGGGGRASAADHHQAEEEATVGAEGRELWGIFRIIKRVALLNVCMGAEITQFRRPIPKSS